MQKQMSYKKIIIGVCAAVIVIAVALAVLLSKKEESFRSILVYDVEGSAVIERETVGSMDAAKNLYLESGDRVSVAAQSSMRMKLDDDKYVMAEADTVFSVEAEGSDADSKTKISLEKGAITNEIQHPLSEGSQYETSTPNSVMAVRGTIYRVELYVDENGEQNTKMCCFQGKVEVRPILPDGTYGEETLVPAGSELTVHEDGTLDEVQEIAYDELPGQAIENLMSMAENGQSLTGISPEELTQFISETEDVNEASENEEQQTEQAEQTEQSETVEAAAKNAADEESDVQQAKANTGKKVPVQSAEKELNTLTSGQPLEQPVPQPQVLPDTPPKAVAPANSGNVENNNAGGGDSQEENNGSDSADDESNDDSDDDDSNDDDSDDDRADHDKPDKDKPDKDEPSKPEIYTVTFMYQGNVFATQTVSGGETVSAPVLMPALSGGWDFDFTTKIETNTTVSWK